MDMFESFEKLKGNSTIKTINPDDTGSNNSHIQPLKSNKLPYEDYNLNGELVGYWWYYGEAVTLEFTIEGEVIVETSNEYVTAEDYCKGRTAVFTLYNFRHESILTTSKQLDSNIVTFDIDLETSKELVKGVYYCSLYLQDSVGLNKALYVQDWCQLTVK